MAETMVASLTDGTRNSLRKAINCALINAVPYMLAKDLRQDFPTLKFDVLVSAIKESIVGGIDNEAAITSGRTPCIILRYHFAFARPAQDIDLRDHLHTNVNPYIWTEQDVHYLNLRNYFDTIFGYRESSELLWYEAPGDRKGYAYGVAGLKPLLCELVKCTTTEDLIIHLQTLDKEPMKQYQDVMGTTEMPPPNVIIDWEAQQ